jgi:hypothetical protein
MTSTTCPKSKKSRGNLNFPAHRLLLQFVLGFFEKELFAPGLVEEINSGPENDGASV